MVYKQPIQLIPLLLTTILVAAVTSLFWFYFWNGQQRHIRSLDEMYGSRVKQLELQLQGQARSHEELVSSLTKAQDARVEAETALVETRADLERVNEQLSTIIEQDWESRYTSAAGEIRDLKTQIEELVLRNDIKLYDLEKTGTILEEQRWYLENEIISLEFDQEELRSSHLALQQELTTLQYRHAMEMQEQAIQMDGLLIAYTGMEKELILMDLDLEAIHEYHTIKQLQLESAHEEKLARLTSELEKERQKAEQVKKPPPAEPVAVVPKKNKQDDSYRTARVKSLGTAIQDRDSGNRKVILISVIPTIPEGITGNELALLLPGMSSDDALSVIQSAEKHIRRPVDAKTLERITRTLDQGAAVKATKILSGQ